MHRSAISLYCFFSLNNHDLVVDCGIPHVPNRGMGGLTVNYNNTIVNSTASYTCNSIGYQLIGKATSVCLVNGTWTRTVPSCECKI